MKSQNIYTKIGTGQNLILLHGWKHDRHTWDSVTPFLQNQFTCWCIDLPGFGENPRPKSVWSIPEYANFVKKFIDENNIKSPILLGHSFGGRVTIELNKILPTISKNILYATPGLRQPIPAFKSMAYSIYQGLKIKSKSIDGLKVLDRVNFMRRLRDKLRSDDYKEAGELRDIFMATIKFNLTPSMELINKPTTLLWGENDNVIPIKIAKEMQKIIKNSKLVQIEGLGHLAHLENPRLFSGKLIKILND